MKRLVDETTDELARSLLQAGIEHRPPPGNKAAVIVALGAGGALGMFSSNAFAWLSTTAGKVTAVSVAVGVAGAVWVAAPPAGEARSAADSSDARVAALRPAAPNDEVTGNDAADDAESAPSSAVRHEATAATGAVDGTGTGAPSPEAEASDGDRATALLDTTGREAASSERRAGSSRRERSARRLGARRATKDKVVASKQSELRRDGPLPAVDTPPAGGALDEGSAAQSQLDTEVRLVDDMHSAARRNDRVALARFLDRYRATFPDGQLKREVAEFAARLEHSDISIAR